MEKCDLTNADISRYSRQLILPQFGVTGQLRLRAARVLIIGCGGLGCPAAVYLTAAGVGTIGLVDHDIVEVNNLHRQVAHSESTVGSSKVSSLAHRCTELNSSIVVEQHHLHLDSTNALDIISKYDVVVDCSDNLATRYLINDACALSGPKPLVSGSALRLEGQMTVYLANRLRTEEERSNNVSLPEENRAPCFRCLFPVPPPAHTVQGCSEAGVFGVVPGIIGSMQAAEVIKILTGVGTVLSGRLFILDMERNLTRSIVLRRPRPDCAVCGPDAQRDPTRITLTDYALFCGAPAHDKPPDVNLERFHNRITVHQLNDWMVCRKPHVLIDLRPSVEVDICHLTPCLYIPMKTLLRDTMLERIQSALNEKLEQTTERPIPIVLLCHRGNNSQIAATQLASALVSFRLKRSRSSLDPDDTMNGDSAGPDETEFVVCDVAGGLATWAAEIDANFPTY